MKNILKKPYTTQEYADFAVYANETHRRVEDFNGDKYALLSTEILQNGEVVDISQTTEYLAEQCNKLKQEAIFNITNCYDYAIKYGVFKIDNTYYGNMSWYNTWTKVLSIYKKTPSLPLQFNTRLYIKQDDIYKNTNLLNNVQSLENMLTILETQQFVNYQPLRDSYLNEVKIMFEAQNVEGLQAIIDLTANNGGFGDVINEQEEFIDYA